MPENKKILQNCDLVSQKKWCEDTFSSLHPLSPVIFATATVVTFVLLRNSRFSFHCYTQREAAPTQKSARKWHCDFLQLLARKITKSIHSGKPASLNLPIAAHVHWWSCQWMPKAGFMCSRATCYWATWPGRNTTNLVCNCYFVQRAGLFRSWPSVSGGLPTIHHLWTHLVGNGHWTGSWPVQEKSA